jgi:hypothetical protein
VPVALRDRPSTEGESNDAKETVVYTAIVAAMSRALGELSGEIADAVRTAASPSR